MERKKILWLCSWYPNRMEPFNGDFIQRHALAAALYNDIYVIHVGGYQLGRGQKEEHTFVTKGGLTEHIIYFNKSLSPVSRLAAQFALAKCYRKAIKKYIEQYGHPTLVHVHVPWKAGLFALWTKKKYKIPFIVTEHWGIYNDVEVDNYKTKSIFFKYFSKKIISRAAKLISVSHFLGDGINRLVLQKGFEVVQNTVDTDLFFYKEKENSVFRFIHVSNMVPLKNAEGILRSFKLLLEKNVNASLVMVGDTGHDIRRYANKLGLPEQSIEFKGEISYSQVAQEMQAANCLLLFSNIENSPCVIGEALCCGLPVIATEVGGIPELVDKTNAILVSPGDEMALSNAMMEMLKNTENYNQKLIAEKARNKFSYTEIGKKLDGVYAATSGH